MPVTSPLAKSTVAIDIMPLVHDPPEGVAPNVLVAPIHITAVPVIDGLACTVTMVIAWQPAATV